MTTTALKPSGSVDLSMEERRVVNELKRVIRRHPDQSPRSLARLVGLAFSGSLGGGGTRAEKLERARARGVLARHELAMAEGGSLSSDEVAALLQISKTAVLKRLKAGKLLAWREERLQAARFPRWQFDDHGQVLSGLEEILEVLDQDARLDVWAKLLFFLRENSAAAGQRPLDFLRAGKPEEARLMAQAYVE